MGARPYLADAGSERDVLHMVKDVKRPDSRRSEVETIREIVDKEWCTDVSWPTGLELFPEKEC